MHICSSCLDGSSRSKYGYKHMSALALYLRVSTADQSVDMQRCELEAYCRARGYKAWKEYSDQGISGAKATRPGLDALLNDIRRRKVGTVVIWSLSRLGRSLKHLLHTIEEFEACGVSLISLKEGWDLGTPTGRMIFQILGALSEWEREQIRERVRSGLSAARARGKRLGRPTVSYEPVCIISLRQQGLSYRQISQAVGVSRQTVARLLSQNPPNLGAATG